jgi:excisionase family DNA binding protein
MQIRSDSDRLLPTLIPSCKLPEAQQLTTIAFGKQMTEPWTSVDDVARHLGVAKDSIYRWIDRRGLPAHRIGRLWKFKISEVDAWVRAGGADGDRESTKKD